MPNCFSLTRKGETSPTSLQQIDREMCEHFKAPCHPTEWFRQWYNTIGLRLALGMTLQQIIADARERYPDGSPGIEVAEWLDANFVADAWAER